MKEIELVELRAVQKESRSKANYIRALQARGAIGFHKSKDGYAAYCPEELEKWKKTARRGRPLKDNYKGE